MSPKDIISELTRTSSFEQLLSKLATEYVPTKTSAKLDGEVAMMLFHAELGMKQRKY